MLQFQTLSVLAGSLACNAHCPFCVSKMTPQQGMSASLQPINRPNLEIACRLAAKGNVTTALITGKGEPTLYPEDLNAFVRILTRYFPLIELQTNALVFLKNRKRFGPYLKHWKKNGLTTIIISMVHFQAEMNGRIYLGEKNPEAYPPLEKTIALLHEFGFSIRLSCIGCRGYIDSDRKLSALIDFCRENKVEQLSWRPVTVSQKSCDQKVYQAARKMSIPVNILKNIRNSVAKRGTLLMELVHGAEVYDLDGQNLCLTNCLTRKPDDEIMRQLIYFPDGHLRYDWEKPGAIIL
ncbi:MAG: radical SAM protein [Desulfobacteraceae bacterium]|nr:MAG: radical SAM protein [Desulfobacteraceae bacterium]